MATGMRRPGPDARRQQDKAMTGQPRETVLVSKLFADFSGTSPRNLYLFGQHVLQLAVLL